MNNTATKIMSIFNNEGVTELSILVSEDKTIKVIILKECDNCYSIKGSFKEDELLKDKISSINSAVDYIGNINPNYQSIFFRTKDKEEKELAKAAGFTYDDDATIDCHSEGADDLTAYSIKNMEYKKTNGQKGLSK